MGHGNFLNLTCDIGDPRHGRHRAKIILSPASKAPVLGDFADFADEDSLHVFLSSSGKPT